MIYVVLGMHKSGTTLVAQILHHSGISMGEIDDGVSYDRGNKYEDQDALHLNLDLLGLPDYEVLHVPAPDPAKLRASPGQREKMQAFIARRSAGGADWGFKDPRTSLSYPLWDRELPEHRIIAVWRSPEEVWPRFRAPGPRLWYQEPRRAWSYVRRWCEHNERLVRFLRETRHDWMLMNYGDFMTGDREFARLQEFVGRPLEDRRRKDLYRGRAKAYPSFEIAKALAKMTGAANPDAIVRDLEALGPGR